MHGFCLFVFCFEQKFSDRNVILWAQSYSGNLLNNRCCSRKIPRDAQEGSSCTHSLYYCCSSQILGSNVVQHSTACKSKWEKGPRKQHTHFQFPYLDCMSSRDFKAVSSQESVSTSISVLSRCRASLFCGLRRPGRQATCFPSWAGKSNRERAITQFNRCLLINK